MKIKMSEIIEFAKTPLGDKRFTPKMNLAIAINMATIEPYLKGFNDSCSKLMEEYMEKDANGEAILFEEENKKFYKLTDPKAFEEACGELENEEVEVNIKTFDESELEKCGEKENMDIPSVSEITAMMFMIERS